MTMADAADCRRMAERVSRLEAEMGALTHHVENIERAQDEIVRSAWRIVFWLLGGTASVIGAAVMKKLGLL